MKITRVLLVPVLALTVNVTTAPQNRGLDAREKKAASATGFRLSLLSRRVSIKVGESIEIDFLIQNVTKRTLVLEETFPEREYEITVSNLRGELAKRTKRGETLQSNKGEDFRVMPIKVNAGEQHRDTIDVAGLYDLSAPGTYHVKASRRVQKLNSTLWIDVESNTATITVTR